MSTYVVSDIHNNWSTFNQLTKLINFTADDSLIINGDLIDRGQTTKPFIEFLKEYKSSIIYILGNHEQMFIEAYETGRLYDKLVEIEANSIFKYEGKTSKKILVHNDEVCNLWIYNGGDITLNSLSKDEVDWLYNYYKKECTYYKLIDDNFFVHAGPHLYDKDYTEEEFIDWVRAQDIKDLVWDRNFFVKYCVSKRTIGITIPYNVFIGHNSMYKEKYRFESVTCTELDNGARIIATDLSDFSCKDNSMLFYCIETGVFYVAMLGQIYTYKYNDSKGYNILASKEKISDYPFVNREQLKNLKRHNKDNSTQITELEFWEKHICPKDSSYWNYN